MRDDNCIFCKIANGEIPSATLYEDEEFRVILDLGPASKGHALILPKNHYRNLYDIDEVTASKAICLAKKMITKMTDVLGCDGYNIVQNNEEAAGQTVFHFHMHLIPRYKNDNVGLGWHMGELTEEDKKEILGEDMLTENREFNEIYEQYKNLILKAAYTYSGSYSAAEDITQDTFLKLYMGYDSMKKKNISSWLFTTAKNAALNYKKKHSREIFEIDENWDSEEDTEKYEAQVKSAEEQFLEDELQKQRLELHEKIFTNLMEKNERWYDAIVLVYYMEMPQAKAAELMGIRLEVLHSLLHRAKKWIKKKYGTEYEEMNRED